MVLDERVFERRLRDQGLRVTGERRAILQEVFRTTSHFDADSLLTRLRNAGRPVSRATVYRTLSHFVETGLIRRVDSGERHARFEPCVGDEHHEHMICVVCGRILEFVEEEIERLQLEACRRHRFRPISHTLQIQGVCNECQRREAGSEPSRREAEC